MARRRSPDEVLMRVSIIEGEMSICSAVAI
jgi:hypothetical protein